MKVKPRFYLQFANCTPVKGYKRSAIYDLQRGSFKFIPNELYEVLTVKNGLIEIDRLYQDYKDDVDSESIIDGYLDFLIENEFGHFIDKDEESFYPPLSKKFDMHFTIGTTIFNINDKTNFSCKTIKILEELGCNFVVLNIINLDMSSIKDILTLFNNSRISGIEIYMEFSNYHKQNLSPLINEYDRVNAITLYNASKNGFEDEKHQNVLRPIKYIDREFQSELKPRKFDFFVGTKFYLEAIHHNVYYNKKMFVSELGNVSNIYNGKSYGNIDDFDEAKIINTKFKEIWSINKDKIKTCKDCEFRYMCLDSRIPIKTKEKKYEYQSECNYNPYEAKWSEDKELVLQKNIVI